MQRLALVVSGVAIGTELSRQSKVLLNVLAGRLKLELQGSTFAYTADDTDSLLSAIHLVLAMESGGLQRVPALGTPSRAPVMGEVDTWINQFGVAWDSVVIVARPEVVTGYPVYLRRSIRRCTPPLNVTVGQAVLINMENPFEVPRIIGEPDL